MLGHGLAQFEDEVLGLVGLDGQNGFHHPQLAHRLGMFQELGLETFHSLGRKAFEVFAHGVVLLDVAFHHCLQVFGIVEEAAHIA